METLSPILSWAAFWHLVLMLVGIGFLSMLTATVASTFVSHDREEDEQKGASEHEELLQILKRIESRLETLESR